jgi:uncharacterized protein YndB with AHSA1/START domain
VPRRWRKTRGIAAIDSALAGRSEAVLSVRGTDRSVVMELPHDHHLCDVRCRDHPGERGRSRCGLIRLRGPACMESAAAGPVFQARAAPRRSQQKSPTMPDRHIRLHRVLRAPPEKLYRAFTEPDALAKWLPPYGFVCTVHQMNAVVGGGHRISFRNFTTGHAHSFGGEYLELVPHRLIRYTDTFDDPNLPGSMQVTVTLEPVSCGTELSVLQQDIPEPIPLEMCYLGWQESLAQLAALVEPDIPA